MNAASPSPTLRVLERRAAVASVLLAANGALGLVGLVPAAAPFFAFDAENAGPLWWAAILGIVGIAVGTIVAFCMWFHRAAFNLRVLEPTRTFSMTPGWAVGWFFVPFANLIKPAHAAHEIWFWSRPEVANAQVPELKIGKAMPCLLLGWWVAWIASNFLDRMATSANNVVSDVVATVANLVAAALCILVVRTITAMQRARFEAQAPLPSVAHEMGHVATSSARTGDGTPRA